MTRREGVENHWLIEKYEAAAKRLVDRGVSDEMAASLAAAMLMTALGLRPNEKRTDHGRHFATRPA